MFRTFAMFSTCAMPRRGKRHRRRRGGFCHRRSAAALQRRRDRARQRLKAVLEKRLAWRPVRRFWLGLAARLVFLRPCTKDDAPGVLKLAAQDLANRVRGIAEQETTLSGDVSVKGAGGDHLCRHHWIVRVGGSRLFLSLSSNTKTVDQRLPYIWVQGKQVLVRRVCFMFRAL